MARSRSSRRSGGTTVAHQDLLVIDMLKNGVANSGEVETLRPSFSSPEPPPIDGDKSANTTANGKGVTIATDNAVSATNAESESSKPLEKQKKTTKKPLVKQTGEPAFVIQLAAFRSAEKAEEIASLLSAKHGSRLDGLKLKTMRLDAGANGIFAWSAHHCQEQRQKRYVPICGGLDRIVFCVNLPRQRGKFSSMVVVIYSYDRHKHR